MFDIEKEQEKFIQRCKGMKGLSELTLKAYRIDLRQFICFMKARDCFSKADMTDYLTVLHTKYKPKSARRKIACVKSFYKYMEMEDIIESNPFHKIAIKYKEPVTLPKTIPLGCIHDILLHAYNCYETAQTRYQKECALRNIIVIELLFSTGMRVTELIQLNTSDLNLKEGTIHIIGKGARERIMCISDDKICQLISLYVTTRCNESEYLLLNKRGNRLSQQSVRNIINDYAHAIQAPLHITPHMFRHAFATELHNEEIDIRYIQQFLGHSSITTTQIYTHISANKTREILSAKHPRNKMQLPLNKII